MRVFNALLAAALLLLDQSRASGAPKPPAKAPALLELRDQYNTPQRLAFPATHVVILAIADERGSAQVNDWLAPLTRRYAERVRFCGLADVSNVPAVLRGTVRKRFRETRKYPVMMDWSGRARAQFGAEREVANILLLDRRGVIVERFAGRADDRALARLCDALDKALAPGGLDGDNNTDNRPDGRKT